MWDKAHCCLSNWTFCCLRSEIKLHFPSQRDTLRHESFLNFCETTHVRVAAPSTRKKPMLAASKIGLTILDARAGNRYGARVAVLTVFGSFTPPLKRVLIVGVETNRSHLLGVSVMRCYGSSTRVPKSAPRIPRSAASHAS
jgi:hypothetical protein